MKTMLVSNSTTKKIVSYVAAILLCLIVSTSNQVEAAETKGQAFPDGETTAELTGNYSATVSNDDKSTIQLFHKGNVVFEQSESLTRVSEIFSLQVENETYFIVNYRLEGSSQGLFYQVFHATDGAVEKIHESNTYTRAQMEVEGNTITIEEPTYAEGSIKTEPASIAKYSYEITSGKVQATKQQKQEAKMSLQSSGGNNYPKVHDKYTNPSYAEISRILTEEALKADIPPEIVKAIAFQESGWQQYWDHGSTPVSWYANSDGSLKCQSWDGTNLKLGFDCIGIGIMQVSDYRYMDEGAEKDAYVKKLKDNIRFNIQEGIKILENKWDYYRYSSSSSNNNPYIPKVNDGNPDYIEHWYFAIMAYNGLLDRNDPIKNPFSPYGAYQEEIFEKIEDYSLIDVTPFPTQKLVKQNSRLLNYGVAQIDMEGPLHQSSHVFKKNDRAYANVNGLNVRRQPGGTIVGKLNAGDAVTVTGTFKGSSDKRDHFVWYPIRMSNGTTGYVASTFISKSNSVAAYELSGNDRNETSAAITNYGWHREQPEAVILGRGDLPIDSLTGSVLASHLDSPILLTDTDALPAQVKTELQRLSPSTVYILGGEHGAISTKVEKEIEDKILPGSTVKRLAGTNRYETSADIASELARYKNVEEIFVTTGDDKSPDALSIAPYAGAQSSPILFTNENYLSQEVKDYINLHNVKKVTIIGGPNAVSDRVKSQLKSVTNSVTRVYGTDRYKTSVAIADKYYGNSFSQAFFARGDKTVDALSASSLAASYDAPIILTKTGSLPSVVKSKLNKLPLRPTVYYLGGPNAISNNTRNTIENVVR
ncbi:cell wall-binding repeat-containing protein [Pontibacillus salicampi]|uniref:Cell wall-binding repeat-containing protein n=1 Tax=Pontibacillus salicampi TaxID=1449801 RepID=A0ABV6LS88_9BACI